MPTHDPAAALWQVLQQVPGANLALARRLGVGLSDVAALLILLREGPVGPSRLAADLDMSTASATVLVDRMVSAGHAERMSHPTDRRRVLVAATPLAARRSDEELRRLVEELGQLSGALDARDRAVVVGYLESVRDVLARFAQTDGTGRRPR